MIEMKGFRVTGPWESAGPYHPQLGGVPVPESKRPENEPGQPPSVRAQFLWAGRTEGKAGCLVPSLEHEAHGVGRQRPGGKAASRGLSGTGASLRGHLDTGGLKVLREPTVEVVTDGDLPLPAALLPETEDPLGPLVLYRSPRCKRATAPTLAPVWARVPKRARSQRSTTWELSIERRRFRACWMDEPGVLPSEVSCFRSRTDWKGFKGAACRVTRVSKKCHRGGIG